MMTHLLKADVSCQDSVRKSLGCLSSQWPGLAAATATACTEGGTAESHCWARTDRPCIVFTSVEGAQAVPPVWPALRHPSNTLVKDFRGAAQITAYQEDLKRNRKCTTAELLGRPCVSPPWQVVGAGC